MALNTGERHFNWRNFIITYFISYGQLAFGYPASIISTTLGSPYFQEYMGLVGFVLVARCGCEQDNTDLADSADPMENQLTNKTLLLERPMAYSKPELSSTPSSLVTCWRRLGERILYITMLSSDCLVVQLLRVPKTLVRLQSDKICMITLLITSRHVSRRTMVHRDVILGISHLDTSVHLRALSA
jgi:hypothetical protein